MKFDEGERLSCGFRMREDVSADLDGLVTLGVFAPTLTIKVREGYKPSPSDLKMLGEWLGNAAAHVQYTNDCLAEEPSA